MTGFKLKTKLRPGAAWTLVLIIATLAVWLVFFSGHSVNIEKGAVDLRGMKFPVSALSGMACEQAMRRPIAVMFSSDAEARPLSGIGQADLVFEMPVTPNGVTRLMAVYQCQSPSEIGSVRSARQDFIPLALGLNAIYAHWGGEREALQALRNGVINNIDGLAYDGTIYYRKTSIRPPHNGFTSYQLLAQAIAEKQYEVTNSTKTPAFRYQAKAKALTGEVVPPLYQGSFGVNWQYYPEENNYRRTRGSRPEIDKNTNQVVTAENVVVMKTTWSPISLDYLRVKTVGSGMVEVYQNGGLVTGRWEKTSARAKLTFYDDNNQEIELVPGSTWVEVIF